MIDFSGSTSMDVRRKPSYFNFRGVHASTKTFSTAVIDNNQESMSTSSDDMNDIGFLRRKLDESAREEKLLDNHIQNMRVSLEHLSQV